MLLVVLLFICNHFPDKCYQAVANLQIMFYVKVNEEEVCFLDNLFLPISQVACPHDCCEIHLLNCYLSTVCMLLKSAIFGFPSTAEPLGVRLLRSDCC